MDFLRKQLKRIQDETARIYARLTVSQRISIVLLALVAALSMVLVMALYSGGDDYVPLHTVSDQQAADAMRLVLDTNDIDYRTEADGDKLRILVPRRQLARARWHAIQSGHFNSEPDNLQWLFEDKGFGQSQFRERGRYTESKRRELEDVLRWSRSIRNVKVVVQKGREPLFSTGSNRNDTALVTLRLAPDVKKLSVREAQSVRLAVHGAFNIPLRNVQITDDRMNNYPYVESDVALSEEESTVQRRILGEIEKIYSHIFTPSEFVVGVLVDVSHRRARIRSERFESAVTAVGSKTTTKESGRRGGDVPGVATNATAGGGLGSAPVPAIVDTETSDTTEVVNENRFPVTRRDEDVPAGEIKGVSVNLVMDQAAVIDILKREAEAQSRTIPDDQIEAEIKKYEDKQRTAITELLPKSLTNTTVHVSTVMFPKPEPPPEIGIAGKTGGWFALHWQDLTMVAIALLGIVAAFLMMRRSIPAPVEIPELDTDALLEEEKKRAAEAQKLLEELESVKRGHLDLEPLSAESLAALTGGAEGGDSLEAINELTREKPDMVSAVVKNWIQDAVKDGDE